MVVKTGASSKVRASQPEAAQASRPHRVITGVTATTYAKGVTVTNNTRGTSILNARPRSTCSSSKNARCPSATTRQSSAYANGETVEAKSSDACGDRTRVPHSSSLSLRVIGTGSSSARMRTSNTAATATTGIHASSPKRATRATSGCLRSLQTTGSIRGRTNVGKTSANKTYATGSGTRGTSGVPAPALGAE